MTTKTRIKLIWRGLLEGLAAVVYTGGNDPGSVPEDANERIGQTVARPGETVKKKG